jgi:carboxypeptidase C (cathepsin A)
MLAGFSVFAIIAAVPAAQVPPPAQSPSPGASQGAVAGASASAVAGASSNEEWSTTQHTMKLGNQSFPYAASAGTTSIKNDAGETLGMMYSVSYVRGDVPDRSIRPVSFLFNGGPGSASMWLHMGSVGPKRVVTVNGQYTPPAPYQIVDNDETLLHRSDLVFIDAMGTGFSRIAGRGTERDFYGVDEDAAAFTQFITTWLSRNGRWNSPKYIIGESYGTFRGAVVANLLQQRGVHLNGLNLLSMVLDLSTLTFAAGDDRAYIYYLPSYAAVAAFHGVAQKPASLEQLLEDARRYAVSEYAAALMKGSALTDAEMTAVAKRLSQFTGLSEDYLKRANLRPTLAQFNAELMRSRRMTAGRIDARFAGDTVNQLTEGAENDPFNAAVGSAYTAAVNHYTREVLKFGGDRPYLNTNGAGGRWNWVRQAGGRGFFPSAPSVQGDLVQAMVANPHMVVQVENGYYDMATPFFPAEYTMSHLGISPRLQRNITLKYYQAGHMMYLRDEDRMALTKNLIEFIDRGLKR